MNPPWRLAIFPADYQSDEVKSMLRSFSFLLVCATVSSGLAEPEVDRHNAREIPVDDPEQVNAVTSPCVI